VCFIEAGEDNCIWILVEQDVEWDFEVCATEARNAAVS
jgi:hypothetical protein